MAWAKRTGIMLCQPLDDKNLERNFKACPKLLAQPKLDGMRCWVQWVNHEPILWSSEGNPITGVPHIQVLLKDWAKICGEISFDGELYNHDIEFEDIISITKRHGENLRNDFTSMQYHIFDYKGTNDINAERYGKLKDIFSKMPEDIKNYDIFKMVPTTVVSRQTVDSQLDRYISEGYEGIILRNPLAVYVEKRPWTILKWKPSKHDTYEVISLIEAISEKGENLGRVGALTCSDRFGNLFSVGPGLGVTHEMAKDIWERRKDLAGKFVRVYYQNLTANGVPRFGKFSPIVEMADTDDEEHF